MNLQERLDLMISLGEYMASSDESWQEAKARASRENGWFTPEFIELSCYNIYDSFLEAEALTSFTEAYPIPAEGSPVKTIGIIMAGNIPLVGFHDMLCVFLSGHQLLIKASAKDEVLIRHLVAWMISKKPSLEQTIRFSEMLKGCDAYIATGSNHSARYFDYYFQKYPHIIRRNRTSVAILTGKETAEELDKLSDDVHLYFGMGCRNVTKIYVPANYDFVPLLEAFKKYLYFSEHHKYKNNYDYQLAIHLLNNLFYMSSGATLLSENDAYFSPVSQLNYQFYQDSSLLEKELKGNESLQCIIGEAYIPFGRAQKPSLTDYADAEDTMNFCLKLSTQIG